MSTKPEPMTTAERLNAIKRIEDDLVLDVAGFGVYNRESAIALSKLQEARLWLIAGAERTGSFLIVDKDKFARDAEAITGVPFPTDKTDETENGG